MKKLVSILLVLVTVVVIAGCGKKQEVDNDEVAPKNTVVTEEKVEATPSPEPQKTEKEEQPAVQEEATEDLTTEEFLEMVDRFNELEDGDPEKEELRTRLDAIFQAAGE